MINWSEILKERYYLTNTDAKLTYKSFVDISRVIN